MRAVLLTSELTRRILIWTWEQTSPNVIEKRKKIYLNEEGKKKFLYRTSLQGKP
jgi:ribosome biogenesis protein Nip4